MKKMRQCYLFLSGIVFLIVTGCQDSENETATNRRLNDFQMKVNQELWLPSIVDNDTCCKSFKCSYSLLDDTPFYTVTAYRGLQSSAELNSDNIFRLQIMNVREKGIYPISDAYGDFTSYARFIDNSGDIQKVYLNDRLNYSSVEIFEILPIEGSLQKGIHGKFSGILFNTANRNDSIVIKDCDFYFERVNWSDFNQYSQN
ncbi:uncharacterized protein DUF5025 [Breznakibacter xylanolyticus]|uniref:Uncharacterized protein DUF5025 n=1 Tax=Breznakibacter xylanolyticus TaxID=990 RepID=A0A2W7NDY9_9BACT|nr:DUF5025 domain-containing protein [Breznakibacter xylanolyticus]PZX09542.1 uncharacterized protein DUF5025 [Breznakibacter xylanolyticus]